jgi:hypothetical protein
MGLVVSELVRQQGLQATPGSNQGPCGRTVRQLRKAFRGGTLVLQ